MKGPHFFQSTSVSPCAWQILQRPQKHPQAPMYTSCARPTMQDSLCAFYHRCHGHGQRQCLMAGCTVLHHIAVECCDISATIWEQQPLLHEHATGAAPRSKGILGFPPPVHKDTCIGECLIPQVMGEACVLHVARNDDVDGDCR